MGSCKILIVDDFADFRRFTSSVLQAQPGFHIIGEAANGSEALEKAKELRPDVILLDIGLPKLNGLEVARRVRWSTSAKILFLSSMSDPDVVREALSLGAGYVYKVCAQRDLVPAIEAVLKGEHFVSPDIEIRGGTDAQSAVSHEVIFCSDDSTLLDSLARFIVRALNEGNPAIVWATEAHRGMLLQRFRSEGVNIDAAIQRGIYIASDVADVADQARILQTLKALNEAAHKLGTKHPRVAACGERAGRLWAEGKIEAAIRLEQLFNDLAKRNDMNILCVYPLTCSHNDDPAFKDLCKEHTAVYSR